MARKPSAKPAVAIEERTFERLIEIIEEKNRAVIAVVFTVRDELRREMHEGFAKLNARVDVLEADVRELKQDVAVLKQDVAVLKQDVAVLKQDVAVLKQDVAVLKQDVVVLKHAVQRLDAKLDRKADVPWKS